MDRSTLLKTPPPWNLNRPQLMRQFGHMIEVLAFLETELHALWVDACGGAAAADHWRRVKLIDENRKSLVKSLERCDSRLRLLGRSTMN